MDHDADHGQRERHLVGDQLGDRAHAAEQRVLRAGRPAADHQPVEAERAERRHEQQRDVRVGHVQVEVDVGAGTVRDGRRTASGRTRRSRRTATMNGASRYSRGRAPSGIIDCLRSSLPRSAIGCSRPCGPTRFGPERTWKRPISRRSTQRHDGEEGHQQVHEHERLDDRDEGPSTISRRSTSASPATGAPGQLMRTAPARSRREVRSGPRWSPPAWRTVTASCSDSPSRAASAWFSITHGARWCASAGVRSTAAPREQRARRDQREPARRRAAPARPRRGGRCGAGASACAAGSGARPLSSLQASGMPSVGGQLAVGVARGRRDLDAEVRRRWRRRRPGRARRSAACTAGRRRWMRPSRFVVVPSRSWSTRLRAARSGSSDTSCSRTARPRRRPRAWASAICQRSPSGHSAVGSTPSSTSACTCAGLDRREHLVAAAGEAAAGAAPRSFAPVGSGSTPPRSCRPSACAAAAIAAVSTRVGDDQHRDARRWRSGPGIADELGQRAARCARRRSGGRCRRRARAASRRGRRSSGARRAGAPCGCAGRARRRDRPRRRRRRPRSRRRGRGRRSARRRGRARSQAPSAATGPDAVSARTSRAMRPQA